jgi:hypothetical protein
VLKFAGKFSKMKKIRPQQKSTRGDRGEIKTCMRPRGHRSNIRIGATNRFIKRESQENCQKKRLRKH